MNRSSGWIVGTWARPATKVGAAIVAGMLFSIYAYAISAHLL